MQIQKIDERKLTLVVQRQELEKDGCLDMEKAHDLAELAFYKFGLVQEGQLHMDLEAFTGAGTVLIFVSLLDDEFHACRFESFDDLADAFTRLDSQRGVALYVDNQKYITVSREPFPVGISEFGVAFGMSALEKAYLDEHGFLVCGDIEGKLGL